MAQRKKSTIQQHVYSKLLVVLVIVLGCFVLRLWNLNVAGRAWDESAQVDTGYKFLQLIQKRDFENTFWYSIPDHPPVSKYIYGLGALFDFKGYDTNGQPFYSYDWTYSRLLSVLFSTLTVLLTIVFGWRYYNFFIGTVAGIILSTLPILLGLSQLVTIESILIFFFTASILSFLYTLEKPTLQRVIVTGVVTGLALGVKYTNILLLPLYLLLFLLFTRYHIRSTRYATLFLIIPISLLTLFLIWPMPWFHLREVLFYNYQTRFAASVRPPPELFFGRFMEVPIVYFPVYLLITTPLIVLVLLTIGSTMSIKQKQWKYILLLVWFAFPFIQSLYSFRQNGIRYIIEIYTPLTLLAAIGFNTIIQTYGRSIIQRSIIVICLLIFLLYPLLRISPYYLDYFNILVGGTQTVYDYKLFPLGWWGEGQKQAGMYILSHAKKGSYIGLQLNPKHTMIPLPYYKTEIYNKDHVYDYVIVNYFSVIRQFFDLKTLNATYEKVYSVKADGVDLVYIYKRKN